MMMMMSIRENVSGDQQTVDDRSPSVSPRVRRVPANRFPLSKYLPERSNNAFVFLFLVTMLTDAISGKRGGMFIQVGGNAPAITGNFRPLVGQSGWRGRGGLGRMIRGEWRQQLLGTTTDGY